MVRSKNKFSSHSILSVDLHKMDHSKKFLSCDTIMPLLLCKHSVSIADDLLLTFNDLEQHCPYALVTRMSIKYKICIRVRITEGG